MTHRSPASSWRRRAWAAALVLPLAACSPDEILKVEDPDIIQPGIARTPAGAEAARLGAIYQLDLALGGYGGPNFNDNITLLGGLLADEYRSGDTFVQRDETDRRNVNNQNFEVDQAYRDLHRARLSAVLAAEGLAEYDPDAPAWKVSQMKYVEGLMETVLAEHFCNGIPFSMIVGGAVEYGEPLTNDEAWERAIAHFDEALTGLGTDNSPEAVIVRNAAKVGKGRALLNLGRFAEAATAVAGVPTSFVFETQHSAAGTVNSIWELNANERRYTVGNNDGGNGLDFVAAVDPRLPTCAGGSTACRAIGVTTPTIFDSQNAAVLPLHVQLKWPDRESPFQVATGVEARLIEAEAQLKAGDATAWLATHNALRATVPGLTALADPGTQVARENLHFRERAFWLFSTAHRVGDLRRMIREFGRTPESVFPTGTWVKGGSYGPDVNFPVTQAEENNPNFQACLDRNA